MDFISLSDAQVRSLNWLANQCDCELINFTDLFMTPKNAIKIYPDHCLVWTIPEAI